MSVRLKCERCGAALKPYKHRADGSNPIRADILATIPTADGRPPTLGVHGNNAFCSVRCGFDWAIDRLRSGKA